MFRRLPLLLLLLAGCQKHRLDVVTASPKSMQQLEGTTWLASSEENSGDTLVYRPNTYRFPAHGGAARALPSKATGGSSSSTSPPPTAWPAAPAPGLRRASPGCASTSPTASTPDYTLEVLALDKKPPVLKLRRLP